MKDRPVFEFFYGGESEQFSFYRIPRQLIVGQEFKNLSTDAKLLYGLMLDRMGLSARNGWYDEENRVFIYYPLDDIKKALNCGNNKAVKLLVELDTGKGIGLIQRVKQGQGRPCPRPDFRKDGIQTSGKPECNYTYKNQTERSYTEQRYSMTCMVPANASQVGTHFTHGFRPLFFYPKPGERKINMTAKRPIAYITAAWSGSRTTDQDCAAKYCRQVYEAGYSPICPNLFLPTFLHESIPQEHKDGLDMAREYLRRSRLLVMCGEQVDETVKNDIAVAQRLHIAATTLEGILAVKGQGQQNDE